MHTEIQIFFNRAVMAGTTIWVAVKPSSQRWF